MQVTVCRLHVHQTLFLKISQEQRHQLKTRPEAITSLAWTQAQLPGVLKTSVNHHGRSEWMNGINTLT